MSHVLKMTFVAGPDRVKQYEYACSENELMLRTLMERICEQDEFLYVVFGDSASIEVRTACGVAATATTKWKLHINGKPFSTASPDTADYKITAKDNIVWRLEETDSEISVPQSVKAVFGEFQRVGDDRIDMEGLKAFCQKLDIQLSTELLQEMMSYADTTGRGISLADFANVWMEQEQ